MLVLLVGAGFFSFWYFNSPDSPRVPKTVYYFWADQIGTLQEGNDITVNGLPLGKVLDVTLQDDAVLVKGQILSNVKLYSTAMLRIETTGLKGERQLAIRLNEGGTLVAPGDTLRSNFDLGANGVGKKVGVVLSDLNLVKGQFMDILHSTLDSADKKFGILNDNFITLRSNVERLQRKVQKSIKELKIQLENADESMENMNNTIKKSKFKHKLPILAQQRDALQKQLSSLSDSWDVLANSVMDEDKGSLVSVISDPVFKSRVSNIISTLDSMVQVVDNEDFQLNVDF